jgi:hypothetical protein
MMPEFDHYITRVGISKYPQGVPAFSIQQKHKTHYRITQERRRNGMGKTGKISVILLGLAMVATVGLGCSQPQDLSNSGTTVQGNTSTTLSGSSGTGNTGVTGGTTNDTSSNGGAVPNSTGNQGTGTGTGTNATGTDADGDNDGSKPGDRDGDKGTQGTTSNSGSVNSNNATGSTNVNGTTGGTTTNN